MKHGGGIHDETTTTTTRKNDIKIELWDDKMKPKLHEWKMLGNNTSKGKPTTESTIEKDINRKKFDRP